MDAASDAPGAAPPRSGTTSLDHRLELAEALLLAIAAVLTAWAAFQATKWSGVQADSYSRASAARTESVRASASAGQLFAIDVDSFTSWVAAIAAEQRAGVDNGLDADGRYEPKAGTESAFLHARFRSEFRPAVDAWLDSKPLSTPTAAPTPFALPAYELAERERSAQLEETAEGHAATARQANQRGDNYVLMTIVFAFVLVLVGIGSKMGALRSRLVLGTFALTALVAACVVMLTFPVEV